MHLFIALPMLCDRVMGRYAPGCLLSGFASFHNMIMFDIDHSAGLEGCMEEGCDVG